MSLTILEALSNDKEHMSCVLLTISDSKEDLNSAKTDHRRTGSCFGKPNLTPTFYLNFRIKRIDRVDEGGIHAIN